MESLFFPLFGTLELNTLVSFPDAYFTSLSSTSMTSLLKTIALARQNPSNELGSFSQIHSNYHSLLMVSCNPSEITHLFDTIFRCINIKGSTISDSAIILLEIFFWQHLQLLWLELFAHQSLFIIIMIFNFLFYHVSPIYSFIVFHLIWAGSLLLFLQRFSTFLGRLCDSSFSPITLSSYTVSTLALGMVKFWTVST